MGFYRKQQPAPGEVRLELAIVGDEVVATIAGPIDQPDGIAVENLPVKRAVRLADELSARFRTDVAVIDPHALWYRPHNSPRSGWLASRKIFVFVLAILMEATATAFI